MIPCVTPNGVSAGYLRPADGLVEFATGTGDDRGGINWNDTMYRVMGNKLVSIDSAGSVSTLGTVGDDGLQASLDYSFDRLGVQSADKLFYWDGSALTQVADPDLGDAIDMIWIDGYFMCTDGEFIVTTELSDPTAVLATKYNSAEVDPDPIKGLIKVRNEAHVVGRYTIEVFRNVGGDGFPFSRVSGAHIEKGAVGKKAMVEFNDQLIFVGGGRNEAISVHQGVNGRSVRIATREIDEILNTYTEAQLDDTVVEYRNDRSSDLIYIHLPDRTLLYDVIGSQALGQPVWSVLTSSLTGYSKYRMRNLVYVYNGWYGGDPTSSKVCSLDGTVSSHFGSKVRWEFGTQILYNEGKGATVDELELIGLTGEVVLGDEPTIATQHSMDGRTFSTPRFINAGLIGDRLKRLVWRRQGRVNRMRVQKFKGDSDSHISFLRLEGNITPLYN
jgi:hypothetical protein